MKFGKCIFANTMLTLTNRVKGDNTAGLGILSRVLNNSVRDRFETDQSTAYSLAYLIELPKKPEYKPFSDLVVGMDAIKRYKE